MMLVGCGSSSGGAAQSMATDAQVNDMVAARKIFDGSTDKNYDALPADQKAEYTKLVHATDEAGAKRWWSTMTGPGGSSNQSSADKTTGPR